MRETKDFELESRDAERLFGVNGERLVKFYVDALERLSKDRSDPEGARRDAYRLLCGLLEDLGLEEIVRLYNKVLNSSP